jgi:hypothetical protein
VPASIKLLEEYGDDLAVVFIESQGTSPEKTAQFIMKQRWMGSSAMWTNERPFSTGSKGLPSFALLSADGKVLAKGNHMTSRDKDLIAAEVKAAKNAPEGTPKALSKAWKNFNKGKIAKAIEEAQKVGAKKPELAEDATLAATEFETRVHARLDRVTWLLENGYPVEAKSQLSALMKQLKGADDLLGVAAEIEGRFEDDSMKLEFEAAGALNRTLDKLLADGRDDKLFDKVTKLAEKYSGTKVAERARAYVAMRS